MRNGFRVLVLGLSVLAASGTAGYVHKAWADDNRGTVQIPSEAPQFFQSLQDVPLMPGLYEMTERALVFDKPEGRIAESAAVAQGVQIRKVQDFYESTLPQMGWTSAGNGLYTRQNEVLKMELLQEQDFDVVRFTISPK